MKDIILNKHSQTPLYLQIYQQLRQRILQGQLSPQSQLLATRRLAQQLDVARVTVTQAYDQLAAEGFVERRTGAGTFVVAAPALASYSDTTHNASDAAQRPFLPALSDWGERVMARPPEAPVPDGRPEIDFGFGRSFPHIFPYDVWRRLLARYLSTDDVMLSRYGSVAGFFPLREALAG